MNSESNRSKIRLAGIFMSGLLIGILMTLVVAQRRAERFMGQRGLGMLPKFVNRLEQKLDFNEAQRESWKRIVENDLKPQFMELHKRHRFEVGEMIKRDLEKLSPSLSAEQWARFDRFNEHRSMRTRP